MGNERDATLDASGKQTRGRALLETDEIIFRPADGAKRALFPRAEMKGVRADGDWLRFQLKKQQFAIELGAAHAAKWADKIARPPGLLDKLGVKAGVSARILGEGDAAFESEISRAPGVRIVGEKQSDADLTFFFATSKAHLKKLASVAKNVLAKTALAKGTAVWVVYPKGQPDPREADVLAAGRALGLKDVKVARFSDTHTALKFVAPKS
jgi:hypothetical protein